MSTLNTESGDRPLRTSDLAAAAQRSAVREDEDRRDLGDDVVGDEARGLNRTADRGERLDPLFPADLAGDFRARWTAVQGSFVDDPREAVQQGDELVAQVMKSLAESFATERAQLEGQLGAGGEASTETLRVALRRYRSFFERLLAL